MEPGRSMKEEYRYRTQKQETGCVLRVCFVCCVHFCVVCVVVCCAYGMCVCEVRVFVCVCVACFLRMWCDLRV